MKIQIVSDLHQEFYRNGSKPKLDDNADYLVLAGDVATNPKGVKDYLKYALDHTPATIICIPGNHEYYGYIFPDVQKNYREAVDSLSSNRVHWLNNETHMPSDRSIEFLCGTLWTDYDKEREMIVPLQQMNDYVYIHHYNKEEGKVEPIFPYDLLLEHKVSLCTLETALSVLGAEKRVIVTHHGPSFKSVHRDYGNNPLNGAYASDLEWLIHKYKPAVWIHGHTHRFFDYKIDETRVICNPYGYPHERDYKECFTIEV